MLPAQLKPCHELQAIQMFEDASEAPAVDAEPAARVAHWVLARLAKGDAPEQLADFVSCALEVDVDALCEEVVRRSYPPERRDDKQIAHPDIEVLACSSRPQEPQSNEFKLTPTCIHLQQSFIELGQQMDLLSKGYACLRHELAERRATVASPGRERNDLGPRSGTYTALDMTGTSAGSKRTPSTSVEIADALLDAAAVAAGYGTLSSCHQSSTQPPLLHDNAQNIFETDACSGIEGLATCPVTHVVSTIQLPDDAAKRHRLSSTQESITSTATNPPALPSLVGGTNAGEAAGSRATTLTMETRTPQDFSAVIPVGVVNNAHGPSSTFVAATKLAEAADSATARSRYARTPRQSLPVSVEHQHAVSHRPQAKESCPPPPVHQLRPRQPSQNASGGVGVAAGAMHTGGVIFSSRPLSSVSTATQQTVTPPAPAPAIAQPLHKPQGPVAPCSDYGNHGVQTATPFMSAGFVHATQQPTTKLVPPPQLKVQSQERPQRCSSQPAISGASCSWRPELPRSARGSSPIAALAVNVIAGSRPAAPLTPRSGAGSPCSARSVTPQQTPGSLPHLGRSKSAGAAFVTRRPSVTRWAASGNTPAPGTDAAAKGAAQSLWKTPLASSGASIVVRTSGASAIVSGGRGAAALAQPSLLPLASSTSSTSAATLATAAAAAAAAVATGAGSRSGMAPPRKTAPAVTMRASRALSTTVLCSTPPHGAGPTSSSTSGLLGTSTTAGFNAAVLRPTASAS